MLEAAIDRWQAGTHTIGLEALPGGLKTQLIEPGERGPIVGRPRPLSGDRGADDLYTSTAKSPIGRASETRCAYPAFAPTTRTERDSVSLGGITRTDPCPAFSLFRGRS